MKKNNLRTFRLMTIMFCLLAAMMVAQQGYAQESGEKCSLATLKGRYQFASAGFMVRGGIVQPFAVAGIDILDGHGNLISNSTLIVNGDVIFQNLIVPGGTYTVRGDCTGTLILGAGGVQLSIFIAPNGDSYDYVQTLPSGNILAGTIRRVRRSTE